MRSSALLLTLCVSSLVLLSACGDDAECGPSDRCASPNDAASDVGPDAPLPADGSAPDANTTDANTTDSQLEPDGQQNFFEYYEEEPNDGSPIEQVNTIDVNWKVSGQLAREDEDWFFFDATPGKIYRLTWVDTDRDWGRQFTVIDAGRGDDAPGSDYIKLLEDTSQDSLEFFAFGSGGHYIAISRQGGNAGSYSFTLQEVPANEAAGGQITFPSTVQGNLPNPGAVIVHPFQASQGDDIEIRLDAVNLPSPSDIDSRIYVYAPSAGSWVMRNDDDGDTLDSRVSAPLPVGGDFWLVVENVELAETISKLDYRLTAAINP